MQMTLRRHVSEAVFAKAVVLVEGDSDIGLLQSVADRDGGLDALGVAAVKTHGKRQLLIPWVILGELGVPTHVVFDADRGMKERMEATSKLTSDIAAAVSQNDADNELLLRKLGASPDPAPPTQVRDGFTVFADTLEAEIKSWPGFADAVKAAREEYDDWRNKSDDAYRQAARSCMPIRRKSSLICSRAYDGPPRNTYGRTPRRTLRARSAINCATWHRLTAPTAFGNASHVAIASV